MRQRRTYIEPGAIRRVGEHLARRGEDSIFLVTGGASFSRCGAQSALREVLAGRRVVHFQDFENNPQLPDVETGLALFRRHAPQVILAVGGGTVLDMAKLIGILSCQDAPPRDILRGDIGLTGSSPPVIAAPTTAGTGSETTHFAAVFFKQRKYSVAHESMLPVCAVVDPELTYSMPPHTTAVTGLDAFCQAVESMWSVAATHPSQEYAKQAIRLAWDNLSVAVHRPSPPVRYAMSKAAHLAGAAINITKTTAAHAISYTMTSRFGLPHGHAVALTLGPLLVYNSRVTERDVMGPRSADQVRQTIDELNRLLGGSDASASRKRIRDLIESLGLPSRLRDAGIRTPADRQLLVDGVNTERLANNPRTLSPDALAEILEEIA